MTRATLALFMMLLTTAATACPAPPPPVRDLSLERYYSDSIGSDVDPAKKAAHVRATAPLKIFVEHAAAYADKAYRARSLPVSNAACGLRWIKAWADGGAYLGTIDGKQAQAQRRWDLAGIALSYLKLKRWATPEDRAVINPWLIKVADATRADFDDAGVKRNNHWYWMGLGLGAVGLAAESGAHWQLAKGVMADAARDVATDGTLPLELARGSRALHYHAFALMPLVTLAELAASKGEDGYALNDGALHRLIAKTVAGLNDPSLFDKLAGVAQERPVKPGAGWIALYRVRFPEKFKQLPQQPSSHRWLGGDVEVLRQVVGDKH